MRKNPITCCGVGIKSQPLGLGDILGHLVGSQNSPHCNLVMPVSPLLVGFHGKEGEGEVCHLPKGASGRSRLVWQLGVVEFSLPHGFQESEDGWRVEEPVPAEEPVVVDDSARRFAGSRAPDDVGQSIEAEEDVL